MFSREGETGNLKFSAALWAISFAAAALLIFPLSAADDIIYDSSYQYFLTLHSFPEIATLLPMDYSPPFYAFALKLFSLLFGTSFTAMRAFSLAAMGGMLFIVAFPVREAFGRKTALTAAVLLLCSAVNLRLLSDIRPLIFALFFNSAFSVYAYLAFFKGKKRHFICMTVYAVLCVYTHNISMLSALGIYAAALLFSLIIKKTAVFRSFLLSGIICSAAYIPWLTVVLRQFENVKSNYWKVEFGLDKAAEAVFWSPFTVENVRFRILNLIIRLLFFAAVFFIVTGIFDFKKLKGADSFSKIKSAVSGEVFEERRIEKSVFLLCELIVPISVLGLFSVLVYPISVPRYYYIWNPVWIIILSLILNVCEKKAVRYSFIAAALFSFGICVYNHINLLSESSIDEMVSCIRENSEDGDIAFLHAHEATVGILSYYFPEARHYVCDETYTVLATYDVFTVNITEIESAEDILDYEDEFFCFDLNFAKDCSAEMLGDYINSYGIFRSDFTLIKAYAPDSGE